MWRISRVGTPTCLGWVGSGSWGQESGLFLLLERAKVSQAGVSLYFCLCGLGSDTSKIVVS